MTEFVESFSGLTYTPNDVQENGTLVLRSSNVSNGEVVDADNVYVNPQVVNSENVKVGDIVVVVRNGSRSLIGKHAQIKAFMPNTVIGAFMTGIRSECPEFTNALLNTSRFEEEIAMNMGATINQITGYMFSKMEFKVPCLDEQKKIGEYFEKLDRLVTLHQRQPFLHSPPDISLIVQLTPPFYTFSWEQRKAIDIADYSKGNGYSKGDLTDAGTPIILYGRLYTKYQFAISEVDTFAFPRNGAVYSQGNEVIVPASGETAEDIARASAVEKSGVLLGGDLNILRPFDFINPLFLALAISNGEPQKELAKKAQGKSVVHIHNTDIQEVTIAYPSRTEQDRIVSVFRQLDNLITLHQRKCANLCSPSQVVFSLLFVTSTFSWEQRKLGELVDRVVRKNTNNESTLPLTISAQYGLVDQITYFNNRVASRDVSNYYLVLNGEFAYNKSTSDGYPFGAVKRLDLYEKGVLSTLYIVFTPKKEQQIDSDFLTVFFDTDRWHKGVAERAAEGARNHGLLNISAEDFFDIDLSVPKDVSEQKQVGAFIRQLDNLITLHQRKPFLMKWRTSDANRNQTNRLVL